MPSKYKRVTFNPGPEVKIDLDFLVEKTEERTGRSSSYGDVIRELASEKKREYDTKQNNAARITTLVEKEELTTEVLTTLVQEVRRLVKSIDRLKEEIKNV